MVDPASVQFGGDGDGSRREVSSSPPFNLTPFLNRPLLSPLAMRDERQHLQKKKKRISSPKRYGQEYDEQTKSTMRKIRLLPLECVNLLE